MIGLVNWQPQAYEMSQALLRYIHTDKSGMPMHGISFYAGVSANTNLVELTLESLTVKPLSAGCGEN